MTAILIFFFGHWLSSVFFQTFYLHRYGAHRQFELSRGWERTFHLLTYLTQGASYLHPPGHWQERITITLLALVFAYTFP